jgi:hypothetical protein
MLGPKLQGTYDRLLPIVQKHDKYAIPSVGFNRSYPWVLLSSVILFVVFTGLSLGYFVPYLLLAIILYFTVSGGARIFLERKMRAYNLNPDELVTYYSCGIMIGIENLNSSTTKGKPQLRKDYQRLMERQARKLLLVLETSWTHGNFKLASNVFGESLSKLKQGFRQKVIPCIENSDPKHPEDLGRIETILLTLVLAQSVTDIEHLNDSIVKLEAPAVQRKGRFGRFSNYLLQSRGIKFLIQHKSTQHILAMSSIVLVSLVVYLIGFYIVGASRDNSYLTAAGIGGALAVGYLFQYGRRQKEG